MWHEKQEYVMLSGDMLHGKQENVTLPGQACPPQRPRGDHMENRILRRPTGNFDVDFIGGSSRKRKLTAIDQSVDISKSNFQYCAPWESNLQKGSLLSGTQVEDNTHGLCLNQSKSVEPTPVRHQFEEDRFHYQNCYSGSWLTSNGNVHGIGTKNISNASSHAPLLSERKGSFDSLNTQVGESLGASNWRPQTHNMLDPSEGYISLPFSELYDARTGKAQNVPCIEELTNFGFKNHVPDITPPGMYNTPSKSSIMEIFQQSFLKPKGHSDAMDGRPCSQEDIKSGFSYELRQSSNCLENGGIIDGPTIGPASLGSSLCIEQNQDNKFSRNESNVGSCGTLAVHLGEISEKEKQCLGDSSDKIKEKTEASDMKNLKHPLLEESSPKNASTSNTAENGQNIDLTHGSLSSDENNKSQFGKPSSGVADELWDGSLQLSSSVTLSAVAFFKSGEKLLDTNWCDSVEVKGKVRLEAFEKYIQDLPRSRNRGLMVISLCWKEGSSETGLTGMKEVAKGYKKGQRVGFAQLSPGIDLYVCPRSDAIITILAKYGFFKGMAAVEDNQDSMIGCVVWRKNQTSSNSVVKKPQSKSNSSLEKPLNSPSLSPMQQAAEKKNSVSQPSPVSNAPASATASSTTEGVGTNGSESENINSSRKIEVAISKSLSGPNSFTASVPSDSTSILVGLHRSAGFNSASVPIPQGDLLKVEAHPTCYLGPEKPKASLENQEPIISFRSDMVKDTRPSSDDDDLPEFDFMSACGISQSNISKPSDALLLDKRLPANGIRNTDRPMLLGMPNVQRSEHLMLPKIPFATNEGMAPSKNFRELEPQIPVFPSMEERPSIQNNMTTAPVGATMFTPKKNLFDDDDDDMPEWCPPELERQSLAETRPSTSRPSELRNPTFQPLARGAPLPVPPPPPPRFPAASYQPYSSQAFPPTFRSPTTEAPQPRPPRRGPNSSMGFNSKSILGPPPRFDGKPPFRPSDKRGRRC